jgi:hypothetical protein
MTMDVRHDDATTLVLEQGATSAPPRAHVVCQSFLVDDGEGVRIEDTPVPGSYSCPDPATWRVSYSGALTDTGATALRTKCETCVGSAVDSFGYGALTLRPI